MKKLRFITDNVVSLFRKKERVVVKHLQRKEVKFTYCGKMSPKEFNKLVSDVNTEIVITLQIKGGK
jgi:predicted ATP-grasp superfamily ATP-dependent carboligase